MSQIADVTTLQAIDNESAALLTAREEVERRLAGSEELTAAKAALETADEALALLRREQRRLDGEIEDLTGKVTAEETRLYDGSVKNPKELGSIQHEVDLLKNKRAGFEDQLLDVLSEIEAAEVTQRESSVLAARLKASWAQEQQQLEQEAARLAAAIINVEERRKQQGALLPAPALSLYERVRARRGAVAVAVIKGGTCSGCRISLPDAVRRQALSSSTLVQCPNCERILALV